MKGLTAMERIIKQATGAVLIGLCFSLTAFGQFTYWGVNHDKKEGGFWHANNPEDFKKPYTWHCTDCHGTDLDGGIMYDGTPGGRVVPSCRGCHIAEGENPVKWNGSDSVNLAPPLDHTISKNGDMHKPGYGTPLAQTSDCTVCHGLDLTGGIGPSCYSCHPRWWAGEGPPVDHTVLLGGTTLHKPGYTDPFANNCTQCHGANLNDGFAPSCYDCHTPPDAPHDFSARPWLAAGDSSCAPCHTWAAWNHTPTTTTNYTVTNTTLATVGNPTGVSAQCLDCHEGNVAVDDYIGSLSTNPPGFTEFITGKAAFGFDLTKHHPVSFTYDTTLATNHGALNDPATTASGLASGGTIAQDMLDTGLVQCTSCHDPHDNTLGSFLVKAAPAGQTDPGLCFTCHIDNLPPGTIGQHHIPKRDDPWGGGMCTACHGSDLLGAGAAPACTDCHNSFADPNPPPSGHHGGDRFDPYTTCAPCHGSALQGAAFGTVIAPSCYECHGNMWQLTNLPPVVDAGGPYTGVVGEAVALDASGTIDVNPEDVLTFDWDFGDGSSVQTSGSNPAAAKIYNAAKTYNGTVTVSDGVNPAVSAPFTVDVTVAGSTPATDAWTITTTNVPPEVFGITIQDYSGSLFVLKDDGVNPPSLAIGLELNRVIFWMDVWIDGSAGFILGTGDTFFGNIDRNAGTMQGLMYPQEGGIATFSGTKN